MKIGKIVKSEHHYSYRCRIYGKNECETLITDKDYHFSQFVKLKIDEESYVIGVITNSELINPEYGSLGPRLSMPSEENFVTMPDFIDETGVLVDISLVGYVENAVNLQEIPLWVVPLNTEVEIMTDQEIKVFHTSENGSVSLKYYNHLINNTNKIGPYLMTKIIDKLDKMTDQENRNKLKLLKHHILCQVTMSTHR